MEGNEQDNEVVTGDEQEMSWKGIRRIRARVTGNEQEMQWKEACGMR
jgi:hypothetical protein